MSEFTENAFHGVSDTHQTDEGAGAAIPDVIPNEAVPRPSIKKRSRKAASPATVAAKSRKTLPGTNLVSQPKYIPEPNLKAAGTSKRGRRRSDETQKADATARRALTAPQPITAEPGELKSNGHLGSEPHAFAAVAGDGHGGSETQDTLAIATIQELWRRRQAWHRAEKSLTLQAKAICRRYVGGDKDEADKLFATVEEGHSIVGDQLSNAPVTVAILPLMMARETVSKHRVAVEKELAKLAKALPIYPWVDAIRGFGALTLAALVGECGDIGSYKSASAVWKRMGLAVVNGIRQRRVTGPDALLHGYSPQRRSVAWNLGVSIMRAQKAGQEYRDFYDADKEKQLAKGLTKGHAHNRACRHMTKRLLARMYGAWRGQEA